MLESLEISEAPFPLCNSNKDFRIDSNFYTQQAKKNPELDYIKIKQCLTGSQYGMPIAMSEVPEGYPIYRMNEIHNMLCDLCVDKYVQLADTEAKDFILKDRDVLFNRTNSFEWVGRTGVYYQNGTQNKIFASYLVRFTTDNSMIQPEYLAAFLSSKHGICEIRRRARESINQTNVNPEEVKEIEIPVLNRDIQDGIVCLFQDANCKMVEADRLYRITANLLLEELGLQDWQPDQKTITTKKFSDFEASGRFDAEYYQPKYDEVKKKIAAYPNGTISFENMLQEGLVKTAESPCKYIELSDLGNSGEITGHTEADFEDLPTRARRKVKTGDVIVSSIEGSLTSCALIPQEYNNALCSTGFHVVRSQEINSETLLLLCKSLSIQMLLKQGCSGTILTGILPDAFKQIRLPLIEKSVQLELASKVQESFALRKESKRLLDLAKHAVEVAIEQGENVAMKLLENEK